MLFAAGAALLLSVLAVAPGGALRSLAVAPWALLLVLAALDLVLSRIGHKNLSAVFPSEVFVGESATLTLTIENAPPGLAARLAWPAGLEGPPDIAFAPGSPAVATAPLRAVRRGIWAVSRIWLNWSSRLGLFDIAPCLPLGLEVRVVPNIRAVSSGAITTTVLSTLYGVKENRAIGEGSEFHQLQDFVRGMDVKTIDWKRSARRRSLLAKELRAERNHQVILALDNGYLMREEIAGLPRIDHAATAALATAWAAAVGGDLVGYFSYDARPRAFIAPTPGRPAFARMRSWTAGLDYVGRETNHTLGLTALASQIHKRSLVIVFTEFVDTTSAELLIESIRHLARRHLVLFVAIRDPAFEALTEAAPSDLGGVARLLAASQLASERQLVLERLHRIGVTVVDARPNTVTGQLVATYLEIKSRDLI